MLSDRCSVCLSCLSVCNNGVLCSNGWMDQDKTWHGDRPLPQTHCVRCGPSSPQKGRQPPIFGPCLLRPNGCMDQDATWCRGRPWPRRHRVRWGPSSTLPKKGAEFPPQFSAHVYWPNCWMDQDGIGMEVVGLGQGHIVLVGDPAILPKKRGRAPSIFGPFLLWPSGWMHQGATWYRCKPQQGDFVLGDPVPPPQKGTEPSPNFRSICLLWPND